MIFAFFGFWAPNQPLRASSQGLLADTKLNEKLSCFYQANWWMNVIEKTGRIPLLSGFDTYME